MGQPLKKVNNNSRLISNKELLLEKMGISASQVTTTTKSMKPTKAPSSQADIIKQKVKDAIHKALKDNGARYYKFLYMATNGKDKDGLQLYREKEEVKLCIPIKDEDGLFDMIYVDCWNKSRKTADFSELGQ